ncbi:MAG: trypsin-like peptidase domain-containing protein [Clostridia bacterium]|nr:trypsin-like peptidase domain-containing protein [Clostridia bacterium]
MFEPFDSQEQPVETNPQAPQVPPPDEQEVKSYTATPYDRYTANHTDPAYQYSAIQAAPQKKEKKTVSLASAVISSAVVSVVCSLLVVLVMVYGMGLGSMLQSAPPVESTVSQSGDPTNTTNIVVDTTAATTAEAVAQKAGPSVVGVVVTSSVNHYFFGSSETASEGSGIVYTADGYVVTNYHVVQSAVEGSGAVSVYLPDDSTTALTAQIIGYDISSDLAVLKVSKSGLTAIELGDSDNLKVGQTAIAIGNPGGMDFMGSVSMGIISGLDRTLQLENSNTEINLIQTDAAINPGNSGGALVNSEGKLIGINSAKMASENFEGMGFAIPVNDAAKIIERIIKNIDAPQPYIGIEISTYYDAETLRMMGYPAGVVVSDVMAGSPAAQAGLKRSDIITHFNGKAVGSYTEFNSEKAKCDPGDTVTLTVYRKNKTYQLSLILGTANS